MPSVIMLPLCGVIPHTSLNTSKTRVNMLGNNLPLRDIPGFEYTAHQPFPIPGLGMVGDIHVDTLLLSWGCMILILGAAAATVPALTARAAGGTGQGLLEMIYEFTADITKGQIGHDWKKFFPLIAGIFIFVLIANFSGVMPWKALESQTWWPVKQDTEWKINVGQQSSAASETGTPAASAIAQAEGKKGTEEAEKFDVAAPSTDFNVTFGLACVALLTYLGAGFGAHGAGYLKLYLNPIEWMDLVIRPATLSLRLMMVITADELMRAAALMMVPVILPTGVMGFELFIGVIQAFVFALLTAIYIGLTVSHH